ncbi:DUF1212-domain-containing protein [Auriculariales sp. MPI-PUGE-AT-0066]|nr:DUF1212-domain-containing protein [Auriculariales sp. MPI-PUGE-AT-0066]
MSNQRRRAPPLVHTPRLDDTAMQPIPTPQLTANEHADPYQPQEPVGTGSLSMERQLERGYTLHNRCRTAMHSQVLMGHGHELPATLFAGDVERADRRRPHDKTTPDPGSSATSSTLPPACGAESSRTRALEEGTAKEVDANAKHEDVSQRPPLSRDKSKFKTWRRRNEAIADHVAPMNDRKEFVMKYAKALLSLGAPTHRIEGQLQSAARMLAVPAQFVALPALVLISSIVTVRAGAKLALGKLHRLHNIYRDVMHDAIGVNTASAAIEELLMSPPQYNALMRLFLAFLDMLAAGTGGLLLAFFQNFVIIKYPMYSNVFELTVSVLVAFMARALSTIPGNLFCYSAISSAGIVLILPGYIILCSALELGSKSMTCGSVRMVYAIVYALFLGFGLTIGSDFYYLVDPRARRLQRETIAILQPVPINGGFTPDNYPDYNLTGVFSFTQTAAQSIKLKGCPRAADDPWYLRPFPFWTLFFLVPTYCTFSSLWKGQPVVSKRLPVMVAFACCSYTANRVAKQYIMDRGDVTSFIGAFVLGILGNLYSRMFQGTAFTSMITGVVFLVPSSLGAGGGLSFTGDLFTQGILLGLRMVQIAIGVTIGLFTSALVVYSFGSRKQTSIFGF